MKAFDKERMQTDELIGMCEERAGVYRLLASLIDREVKGSTREMVASLADTPIDADADTAEGRCERGLRTMGECVASDWDEDLENLLACDFARIFLAAGRFEGKAAVPYESIYTSEEELLMQEARDQVRAIFRDNGVMPGSEENIPEDYLPFELEFMAVLGDRTVQALKADDIEDAARLAACQSDFLDRHLLNWVDELIKDIDRMAETPFYHALADALGGFIACEADDVDALVDACALREAC